MTRERDLRATLVLFTLALVGTSLLALVAGWVFGRISPERAGNALVGDLVIEEPTHSDVGDPAAPTSGRADGEAACGVRSEPVPIGDQLAALEAGIVVIQFRPESVGADARSQLAELAAHDAPVVVAPNRELASAVAATASERRLPLEAVSPELLATFVSRYGDPDACPAP